MSTETINVFFHTISLFSCIFSTFYTLYYSYPSAEVGEQGHFVYKFFDKVVWLTENHRVSDCSPQQEISKQMLVRLRNGESPEMTGNYL